MQIRNYSTSNRRKDIIGRLISKNVSKKRKKIGGTLDQYKPSIGNTPVMRYWDKLNLLQRKRKKSVKYKKKGGEKDTFEPNSEW